MRLKVLLPKETTKRDAATLRRDILNYADAVEKGILVEDVFDPMVNLYHLRIVMADKSTPQDIFNLGEFIGFKQTHITHEDKSV